MQNDDFAVLSPRRRDYPEEGDGTSTLYGEGLPRKTSWDSPGDRLASPRPGRAATASEPFTRRVSDPAIVRSPSSASAPVPTNGKHHRDKNGKCQLQRGQTMPMGAVLRLGGAASYREKLLPISVSIHRTEVERNLLRQATAHYILQVGPFGMQPYEISRTFEEFVGLFHRLMRSKVAPCVPALPASGWHWSERPELIEERRSSLERWINDLLTLTPVVGDGDERLFRFLSLPRTAAVASRFVVAPMTSRGLWLQPLHEATSEPEGFVALHDGAVKGALVELLQRAITPEGELALAEGAERVPDAKLTELRLICEMLSRLFRSGGASSSSGSSASAKGCVGSLEGFVGEAKMREIGSLGNAAEKCAIVRALVVLSCLQEEQRSPGAHRAQVAAASSKTLLTLARGSRRGAWAASLAAFVAEDGIQRLADAVGYENGAAEPLMGSADGSVCSALAPATPRGATGGILATLESFVSSPGKISPGRPSKSVSRREERLVAELLLRGADSCVSQQLASADAAPDRRRLLNRLFESEDAYVRVSVGLILAQLVCEDGFEDADKACNGLGVLCDELEERVEDLRDVELVLLLLEEDTWAWLCRLAASQRLREAAGNSPLGVVCQFALLVITSLVQPSPALVTETRGFQETLLYALRPDNTTTVRFLASKLLLTSCSACGAAGRKSRSLPTAPGLLGALETAVLCGVQASIGTHARRHMRHTGALQETQRCFDNSSSLQQVLEEVAALSAAAQAEATSWAQALEAASERSSVVVAQCSSCKEGLDRQQVGLETLQLSQQAATNGNGWKTPEEALRMMDSDVLEASLAELQASVVVRERDLKEGEQLLQDTLEQRMGLVKELAELEQAARQLETAAASAETALAAATVENAMAAAAASPEATATDAMAAAAARKEACRTKLEAVCQRVEELRAQVAQHDEKLQVLSDPLPAWRGELSEDRQRFQELRDEKQRRLAAWAAAQEAQDACDGESKAARSELKALGQLLTVESAHRVKLRSASQALAGALQEMERQMQVLDAMGASEIGLSLIRDF
eukprot:TRINITY_DN36392_c0_g1_i1.p1 TRINITY_DN36392_c0_g1~~TRINITY_DN36392_c0_g1_i1.p1  ORF type:complete len:1044 (-),score=248.11 TRINITY_DN36392_c0_g1_i1:76-3207(-)